MPADVDDRAETNYQVEAIVEADHQWP